MGGQYFGRREKQDCPLTTKYVHIKSTTVYAPRRNWDSPQPPTRRLVCPLPLFLGGGEHSLARKELGESQFRRGACPATRGLVNYPATRGLVHCHCLLVFLIYQRFLYVFKIFPVSGRKARGVAGAAWQGPTRTRTTPRISPLWAEFPTSRQGNAPPAPIQVSTRVSVQALCRVGLQGMLCIAPKAGNILVFQRKQSRSEKLKGIQILFLRCALRDSSVRPLP